MSRTELADAVNAALHQACPDRNPAAHYVDSRWVGKLERGEHRWPSVERRAALRLVFQVRSDVEIGLFSPRRSRALPQVSERRSHDDAGARTVVAEYALTGVGVLGLSNDDQVVQYLRTPSGRALPGVAIPTQLYPAIMDDYVVTETPPGYATDPFLLQPGRALVVGQTTSDGPESFLLDSRHARRRLRRAGNDSRLVIPRAYRLDELTFALLWAVANFDAELLADDASLADGIREAGEYARMPRSAASRDLAADLSNASFMWLGSQFCADHILRHAAELGSRPTFWTREQRGEEASAWLLFAHKSNYLRATAADTTHAEPITRSFCIPPEVVTASPLGERALLLLAVALMESYGIRTHITDAGELAATPGFALAGQRRAITATWIGADGIWYVDVTDNRATLQDYTEAAGYAAAHSITMADDPHDRLRRLADYLSLDWEWLAMRCHELGERGASGIAQPRSRLLSLHGVDRALRFVGASARQGQ